MNDLDFEREILREELILDLLWQQEEHGMIACPKCWNHLEPDAPSCHCGWINPLVEDGII